MRSVRRDLPPYLSQIHASIPLLDAAMNETESRFLEVSNRVESSTTAARDLVRHGEALIALAKGHDGGEMIVETAAAHISAAIGFVERNVSDSQELIRRLITAHEQITRSLAAELPLARALAPLTYVETLFRVESACLPPEVQMMFQSLVMDIERVRQNVEGGFRERFQLIRDTEAILGRAIAELTERTSQADQASVRLRKDLVQSLARMKASYERNCDQQIRLGTVSREVAAKTEQVVMSLQFFDTFTQKLQHARSIVAEMDSCITRLPDDRSGTCRALRFLQQSGRVCGAQLGAMTTELGAAGVTVSHGLQAIADQMKALDSDCIALCDLDNVTTGVDGAVQILLDAIADSQKLVSDAELFALDSYKTIEPVGRLTTNFTRFMHQLSLEIQLIGLNAEVQSAQVGQGTGLEVLSAQTSAISRETSRLSSQLAVQVDTLTAELSQVVSCFLELRDSNVEFRKALVIEAAMDNGNLHGYRDRAIKVLQKISEVLPDLETQTRQASQQADFVRIATTPLVQLQGIVMGLTLAAELAADRSGLEIETADLTDHFFKIYTIRSEADVHRQALGQAPLAPVAASLSEDVDLFGFDGPAPSGSPSAAEAEVDLWLDIPSALEQSPAEPSLARLSATAGLPNVSLNPSSVPVDNRSVAPSYPLQ